MGGPSASAGGRRTAHSGSCSQVPTRGEVLRQLGWAPGKYPEGLERRTAAVDGLKREFLLFSPPVARPPWQELPEKGVPLWLLAPGYGDFAEKFLAMSGMYEFAKTHNFAFAVLEGYRCTFNVHLRSQPYPDLPNDVAYALVVMREARLKMPIDTTRIRCVGYSRGARFCARLASELSSYFGAIGVVSGIRFPQPNNATQAVPIIAFHGTKDPVNPFKGDGRPEYWNSSVPDAVERWARFNGCASKGTLDWGPHVKVAMNTMCNDEAEVWLVQIHNGGHTWPNSSWNFGQWGERMGRTTHEIDARQELLQFFLRHGRKTPCYTTLPGEKCHATVQQVLRVEIAKHPERFPGLTQKSSFADVQSFLHHGFSVGNCPLPCRHQRGGAPGGNGSSSSSGAPGGGAASASSAATTTAAAAAAAGAARTRALFPMAEELSRLPAQMALASTSWYGRCGGGAAWAAQRRSPAALGLCLVVAVLLLATAGLLFLRKKPPRAAARTQRVQRASCLLDRALEQLQLAGLRDALGQRWTVLE